MLLLRANTLALGHSGCRPLLVDRLLAFLELGHPPGRARAGQRRGVRATWRRSPISRCRSSGAGERRARAGRSCPRSLALREVGLEPLDARGQGRAGAAQRDPADGRDRGAAPGRRRPADADRQRRRGDERRGAARDGRRVRRGLPAGAAASRARSRSRPSSATSCATAGSSAATTRSAHKVQDPYSLRCVPQVHGAVRDALDHLRRVLDIELNSATDNPLVFPGGGVADAGHDRDRRRPGDQRRQLPRRADRAGARLREARARRARLDQRAADRAARRRAAERRPAAVPRRRPRASTPG